MKSRAILLFTLASCALGLLRLQDPSPSQEVLAIEQAMQKAIQRAEPSIVTIVISRSDAYRKLFHDQPPADQPGKLGVFDPKRTALEPGAGTQPGNSANLQSPAHQYDLSAPDYLPESGGSGVIIDENQGLVLTNYHIVRDATKAYVRLASGKGSYADIHAADPRSDLAVLRLLDEKITPLRGIKFGDGGAVRKGQLVVALANPFGAGFRDYSPGASWGIISNVRRRASLSSAMGEESRGFYLHSFGTLLQTDSRLNRGCSGGALINLKGEMIGLTTSRPAVPGSDSSATSSSERSLGSRALDETPGSFAVPMDGSMNRIIARLKEGKEVEYGFLGITFLQRTATDMWQAPPQIGVIPGSPAEKGELREGEWIKSINEVAVQSAEDLLLAIALLAPGSEVRVQTRERATPVVVVLAKSYVPDKIIVSKKPPAVRGIRVDYTSVLWMQQEPGLRRQFQRRGIQAGVYINELESDSPAARSKLQVNDVVTQVNGRKVDTPSAFYGEAAKTPASSDLELTLQSYDWARGSRATKLSVPPK
jgi:S1-C subfamily serine protease